MRAAYVGVRRAGFVADYQVANAIVKVSRAHPQCVAPNGLLRAHVIARTGFGLEVRIGEEERREILEQLAQGRSFESRSDTGLQLGAGGARSGRPAQRGGDFAAERSFRS